MIALASECLVFRLASGEQIPLASEMISAECLGEAAQEWDPEFVNHAASGVFHYFKHELGRHTVTVAEFAEALENVLRGFKLPGRSAGAPPAVAESDLSKLATESGKGCELFFFPALRAELRHCVRQGPKILRFHGLRGCVKHLAGTRRWNCRCRKLQEQIVLYLRGCLAAEAPGTELALMVE